MHSYWDSLWRRQRQNQSQEQALDCELCSRSVNDPNQRTLVRCLSAWRRKVLVSSGYLLCCYDLGCMIWMRKRYLWERGDYLMDCLSLIISSIFGVIQLKVSHEELRGTTRNTFLSPRDCIAINSSVFSRDSERCQDTSWRSDFRLIFLLLIWCQFVRVTQAARPILHVLSGESDVSSRYRP